MDEFYLPEDIIEWLGLKKSEYLARLIEHSTPDDFQFEHYLQFDQLIPNTLANPDFCHDWEEDAYRLKCFVRSYSEQGAFQQVVVGALIPDQEKKDVYIPIISFVTRKEAIVRLFAPLPLIIRH